MPYRGEVASKLGHVDTARDQKVQEAMQRWQVVHAAPVDGSHVQQECRSLESLPGRSEGDNVRFALTVDGSDTEVEATTEYPSVKVGYLRVAGSFLDLEKLDAAEQTPFVDSSMVRRAHRSSAFSRSLPGSSLVVPGLSAQQSWRSEVHDFLVDTPFDDGAESTLADALLAIHGAPAAPASTLPVRMCPECSASFRDQPIQITPTSGTCPECGRGLYVSDVIRASDEFSEVGSNLTALTRIMLLTERLVSVSYIESFMTQSVVPAEEMFARTIFITDGPLALMGTTAPLKRRMQYYNEKVFEWAGARGAAGPFIVGIEKTGQFVEHATLIREHIPRGSVMRLTTDYINRITGRTPGHEYGVDEYYGHRFIFRTSKGDTLVITVPPAPGVQPYAGQGSDDFESYPTLRAICETLDRVRTRLYPNSVIPVALAHNSAALPLGVGHSVLQAMAQELLKVPRTHQIQSNPRY